MEFFAPLFSFVTDNSKKSLQKLLVVIFTITILLFLDNLFGFSYYYNLSKKVGIATEIHGILKDKDIDINTKNQLVAINKQVLNHTSLKDIIYDSLINYDKPKTFVHLFLFWLTASSSVVFMMAASIYGAIKALKNPLNYIFQKPIHTVVSFIIVIFILFFISIILTICFALIPLISDHVYYNYILNICANGFLLWIFSLTPIVKVKPTTPVDNPPSHVTNES